MHQTLLEAIKLVTAEVAGQRQYLALCIHTIITESPPTYSRPMCLFRQVQSVDGARQPWLWQKRPYVAAEAGELLVFRDVVARCIGCAKQGIKYGFRDARNRIFCQKCSVPSANTALPTDPLTLYQNNREILLSALPTRVWPDQFPVFRFQDLLRREVGEEEALNEVDGSELDALCLSSRVTVW